MTRVRRPCQLLLWLDLLLVVVVVAATVASAASPSASKTASDTSARQAKCTVKGRVFTERDWYGYLVNKAFHQNYAKIEYQITYPVKECCTNLLIYYDDQVKHLDSSMTCEERTNVLPADNNQVIPLRATNDTNGCTFWNETGEAFYVCRGERIFRSSLSRTWFFALSRCGHTGPLNLNYVFNITGYYGECEEDPLAPTSGWTWFVNQLNSNRHNSSDQEVYKYLSISLGIVAGLALILAAVFFGLWFLGLRNAAKGKGSSVTSSQATMTQDDIFYVNPSLSDREQQEYSQSGSENYYEVIPERRSYESINAGLANGGAHLRQLRSLHGTLGHHPHGHPHALGHPHAHGHAGHPHGIHHPHPLNHSSLHHPAGRLAQTKEMGQNMRGVTYMFEDYPPPPYQPPKLMQGLGKSPHNPNAMQGPSGVGVASSSMAGGHHHTLSLPANQRQRPNFVHHAYHSSLVPTPAALGLDNGNNNTIVGNIATSSSGMMLGGGGGGINTIGSIGNPISSNIGPMMSTQMNPNDSYHPDTIPINAMSSNSGMPPSAGQSLSLGTFGVSSNSNNNGSNMNSINSSSGGLSNHNPHQMMGGLLSHSSANPTSSLSVALNSTTSSQVPPPSSLGQCETSA